MLAASAASDFKDLRRLGQSPQGVHETNAFVFPDKGEHVATLAAAETAENLFLCINVEARRLLLVERTQAREILSRLFQANVFPHHADDVRLLLHAIRK